MNFIKSFPNKINKVSFDRWYKFSMILVLTSIFIMFLINLFQLVELKKLESEKLILNKETQNFDSIIEEKNKLKKIRENLDKQNQKSSRNNDSSIYNCLLNIAKVTPDGIYLDKLDYDFEKMEIFIKGDSLNIREHIKFCQNLAQLSFCDKVKIKHIKLKNSHENDFIYEFCLNMKLK